MIKLPKEVLEAILDASGVPDEWRSDDRVSIKPEYHEAYSQLSRVQLIIARPRMLPSSEGLFHDLSDEFTKDTNPLHPESYIMGSSEYSIAADAWIKWLPQRILKGLAS